MKFRLVKLTPPPKVRLVKLRIGKCKGCKTEAPLVGHNLDGLWKAGRVDLCDTCWRKTPEFKSAVEALYHGPWREVDDRARREIVDKLRAEGAKHKRQRKEAKQERRAPAVQPKKKVLLLKKPKMILRLKKSKP